MYHYDQNVHLYKPIVHDLDVYLYMRSMFRIRHQPNTEQDQNVNKCSLLCFSDK